MTSDEKIIAILGKYCTITIYPRAYPPCNEQGYLPSQLIYTSLKEGDVSVNAPFCVGYKAECGNKIFVVEYCAFAVFIDALYEELFPKKQEVPLEVA